MSNQSSGLYSVHSDELNEEQLREKRKNESYAYIIGIISQFIWALNSVQIKTFEPWFPDVFTYNSLLLWRSIPIWALGYYFCKKKNIHIIPVSLIKYKFWFFLRSFGNYIGVFLWLNFPLLLSLFYYLSIYVKQR